MVPTAYRSRHPKRHLDRFSRFCMGPNAVQCIVSGEENTQNCPFPLGFRNVAGELSHGHRQRAEIGKDRACSSGDILADRRTERHTDT